MRAGLVLAAALVALVMMPARSLAAGPCGPPVVNPVACENTLTGDPESDWTVDGVGDTSIQGYTTAMSVTPGSTVTFKIKSATNNFHFDILRMGYYGGDGARKVASNLSPTGDSTNQPNCLSDASTGLIDCGNWHASASWTVPSTAVSGVYIAHLTRNDTGGDSQIIFVVRSDTSHSDVVVQTSDATWQAYNNYGGNNLYTCTVSCPPGDPLAYKSAFKVSYNRPLLTAESSPGGQFFSSEYPMIRFLEANGYDVSYLASSDVAERGSLLLNHKLFISSGHDEYWSASQRANLEAARNAGVNEAFFSGNEGFWKTRWENSTDGSNTPDRTLVAYKDTHFNAATDPVSWTGTWRDPRFTAPGTNTPENALTGQSFIVNSGSASLKVPAAYGKLRLWRNTPAATQTAGATLTLGTEVLGYEWDADADNGFRPPGTVDLSSTTVSGLEIFSDYGSTTTVGGTATHNLTLYRQRGGGLVFGAGTVQWAWALDAFNGGSVPVNATMKQATVNLLADMSAQPATLQTGLVAATKSTDTTPPTSTITSPPASAADGAKVTLTGTASDTGGQVAGVEVSTDGGSTWHPASGTSSWTYTWIAHGNPTAHIMTRATDDSANTETPGAGVNVAVTCPCSLWGSNVTPINPDTNDSSAVEVGVKFKADSFGQINGVRFYKATANTGTHTGSVWTTDGQRLASATFTGETVSGWQDVTFSNPVIVQPGTTYIASYFAPNGHYVATPDYFWRAPAPGPNGGASVDSGPLHAIQNAGTTTNGVFSYGPTSTFPSSSFNASNYWVDVDFVPIPAAGQATNVTAVAGGKTSANVSWSAPSSGGTPTSYTITPYIGSTPQTPKTITGTPPLTTATVTGLTQGTTYTFTVRATNPAGAGAESAQSNSVTPQTAVAPAVPTGVSAVAASQSAKVSWTTPSSDGDSPITGYAITPFDGTTALPTVQAAGSVNSATVTGLTDGTPYTFKVTAQNLAGNSPQSDPSNTVTPQQTIFDFATPSTVDGGDNSAVELGVKFKAAYDGTILGLRFYKAAGNGGTHVGSLWSASGTLLARATFTNETASGWQTVNFSSPVSITAGTTYVASYFAPSGHYSITLGGNTKATVNGPLTALASSTSPNGVFMYANSSAFPSNSDNDADYGVDVMYALPKPGQVTGVTASAGGPTSARVSWTAPASGGPVLSYRITPFVGSTAQTPKVISGSPPSTGTTITGLTTGTTYTFKVEASNPNGAGPISAASGSVTPQAPVAPGAPTGVTAQPESQAAKVSWTAPDSDGQSPITGYTITPFVGATAGTPVTAGGSATSATVTGLKNGTDYTFKVSATNAIGTGAASAASDTVTPQAMLFDLATPSLADAGDENPVVLGVKFKSDIDGSVTGLRFYKSTANTGTHVGALWASDGTQLAQATFTNETDSGWQRVALASPVQISAGKTYVASYLAPNGHYSLDTSVFGAGVDNPPLHGLPDAASGGNGVFTYSSSSVMPSNSWNAANYWVDVTFQPDPAPGVPSAATATPGNASATVSWTAPSSGGRPSSYLVTPYVGSTAQTPQTVTGSPLPTSTTVTGLTAGTSYTFTVKAVNSSGSSAESAPSAAVTPLGAQKPGAPTSVSAEPASQSARVTWTAPASDGGSPITGYTVTPYDGATAGTPVSAGASATSATVTGLTNGKPYTFTVAAKNASGSSPESTASTAVTPEAMIFDLQTPGTPDAGDAGAVNLGVKFQSDVDGSVTGVRFYKSAANTGTHVGSLWATDGTLLGRATFAGESASGWQTATFTTPAQISAGKTYIASYLAPNGHYALTGNAFGSAVANPPLKTLADGVSANGVFSYGATSVLPTDSFNAANYWVDVAFQPDAAPGQVTGVAATAGIGSANVSWNAPSSGGRPASYVVTPYVGSTAQASKTVTGSPPDTSTTVSGLTPGTLYTFKVQAVNGTGAGSDSAASGSIDPETTLLGNATPAVDDSGEGNSVNVGLKFKSDVAGSVTGVRFYKTSSNSGAHVGSLWSSSGTLLGQVAFAGESGSGWQLARFATPVTIAADTTYVVSYLAPNGHYSLTSSAFGSPLDNAPLHALADGAGGGNGVYAYGTASTLPTSSFNAADYFVDVTFAPGAGS